MEQKLLQALLAHYNGKLQVAEANLLNSFKNSTSVGDHSDVVGELIKLVDQIAAARGSLDVVQSLTEPVSPVEQDSTPEK